MKERLVQSVDGKQTSKPERLSVKRKASIGWCQQLQHIYLRASGCKSTLEYYVIGAKLSNRDQSQGLTYLVREVSEISLE
jgi:hypothetical protein